TLLTRAALSPGSFPVAGVADGHEPPHKARATAGNGGRIPGEGRGRDRAGASCQTEAAAGGRRELRALAIDDLAIGHARACRRVEGNGERRSGRVELRNR